MVQSCHASGRMRYGPGSARERHNDGGGPSAIQHSQESLRALAGRYGINSKTVAKWKKRFSAADLPTGPKEPRSTVLSIEDEGVIVAFRKHTLLPLDDCLYALQATIPHLTRSSLHRCLQRHGIGRLPTLEGAKPAKKAFSNPTSAPPEKTKRRIRTFPAAIRFRHHTATVRLAEFRSMASPGR